MPTEKIFRVEIEDDLFIVLPLHSVSSLAEDDVQDERNLMLEQLQQQGSTKVIIDFIKVEYFGSSLLEVLLSIWQIIDKKGGKMALCNLSDVGKEVIQISKFDTLWPIHPSREEAIQAVNS